MGIILISAFPFIPNILKGAILTLSPNFPHNSFLSLLKMITIPVPISLQKLRSQDLLTHLLTLLNSKSL